ncbi:NUDIX hydrolase [Mesobacillus jeotgali]|uniref:NUDIX hydrolase n=1 Tax=Mesobacillus jeotgali TaxID=129985 RepID=UPI0021473D29|nr:NUDIX hydrolase [Mesobacillus jeotgali]
MLWEGAAGVCINRHGEMLMVLQGKADEKKLWSVPAGGKEREETFEQCCIREVFEETGYEAEIIRPLFVKTGMYSGINVKVQYYEIRIAGGEAMIQDTDGLIHEIAWKRVDEMETEEFGFKEDIQFLIDFSNGLQII